MKDTLLSRREVATSLGVSLDTVARLVSRGELRPVRIGASVLIPASQIRALVERGGAETRTPKP
jgi:excisionase family DNA binding protein